MAKNIFMITVSLPAQIYTIKEIAEQLVTFYTALGKVDNIFYYPDVIVSQKRTEKINLCKDKQTNIQLLANYILNYNLDDIRQYEKEKHPTIDYKRDFGFRCFIYFDTLHLHHIIGRSQYDFISSLLGSNIQKDFIWYFDVLKKYVDFFNAVNAVIKIITPSVSNESIKYSYPLGWITYFSKDSKILIPDNLNGFEYEYTEKGKYLIATREDFTISKEAYQEQKDKLLKTMEYLGKTVPGYLKNE